MIIPAIQGFRAVCDARPVFLCALLTLAQCAYSQTPAAVVSGGERFPTTGSSPHLPLNLFDRGVRLHARGEERHAIEQFEKAVHMNPRDVSARLNLGILYGNAGRDDGALREFRAVLEMMPECAAAHFNSGVILMKQERFPEAIKAFERTLAMGEFRELAHYNLAVCHEYSGGARYGAGFGAQKSIAHYREVLKTRPENAVVHYNLGMVYLHSGDAESAERELKEASRLEKDMADAFFQLGILMLQKKQYFSAVNYLLEAARIDSAVRAEPHLVRAYGGLAAFFMEHGDCESAARYCEEVLGIDPEDADALARLGSAYRCLKRYEEAAECLESALLLDPGRQLAAEIAEIHSLSGDSLAGRSRHVEAARAYRRAIEYEPGNGVHSRKLASLYDSALRDRKRAVYWYSVALSAPIGINEAEEIKRRIADAARSDGGILGRYRLLAGRNPEDPAVRYNLGVLLHIKGDLDGAIAEYRRVVEIDPENSFARYNLGVAYSGKGMRGAAIREYETALQHNPKYVKPMYALGRLHEEAGDYERARLEYERVLSLEPDSANAHLALGLLLQERLKDPAGAKEHLERYAGLREKAAPVKMP